MPSMLVSTPESAVPASARPARPNFLAPCQELHLRQERFRCEGEASGWGSRGGLGSEAGVEQVPAGRG